MEDSSRVFIAIDLDKITKEKLNKAQNILRDCSLNIKWVSQDQFHITLKFLGDITVDKIEEVKKALEDVQSKISPFNITINGLGAFPNKEYPKIIWAGLSENSEKVTSLHQIIEEKLTNLGFEEERHSYKPHITLGRIRDQEKNYELISDKIREFPFRISHQQIVNKITVLKSELTSQGPIYSTIAEFKLGIGSKDKG